MDITITVTTPQGTRIAQAIGNRFALGRNATEAEINQFLLDHLEDVVIGYERQAALAATVIEAF